MIIYNPLDGQPLTYSFTSKAKHCFLITHLRRPVPPMVTEMRAEIEAECRRSNFTIVDAEAQTTGRDFLLKIWKLIASTPLSIGVLHEDIPRSTEANIFYEIGVAQALGKETLIVKSPAYQMPSDFTRTEYLKYDNNFGRKFKGYMASLQEQADFYERLSDQLEKDPVLALDYLKRAFLLTGNRHLQNKAKRIVQNEGLERRAANSVESIAAAF